jgi:aspartyl-tRNA(Asn)/glutamyl-tRNA(Gln) amidotransferase subunit C
MDIDIKYFAKLAKLDITSIDQEKFVKDMTNIITMVEHLPEAEESFTVIDDNNKMDLRQDVSEKNFNRDELLKNAPQIEAGCVVVPNVIE